MSKVTTLSWLIATVATFAGTATYAAGNMVASVVLGTIAFFGLCILVIAAMV